MEVNRSLFIEKSLHVASVIKTLEMIMFLRDAYTAQHQKRVADLAQAIGRELGLPETSLHILSIAGKLHDIGKMYVPIEILTKPGEISDVEYTLVQKHATVGHAIVSQLGFATPIAEVVLQHHERNDGSGYPYGLKQEDILIESQILAVADVVEAIVAHRPYRPALGLERALSELENNQDKFNSAAAEACAQLFHSNSFSFK